MTVEDMQINHEAHAILAQNWVDVRDLDIAVTNGVIHVRGHMALLTASQLDAAAERDDAGVGPRFLARLELDLLKIHNVHFVHWELDRWRRTGMGWQPGRR